MLQILRNLIAELDTNGLTYCHWKSNLWLASALAGATDVDLLIARDDAAAFRSLLGRLGFRPARTEDGGGFPMMAHYYGFDEETGALVHVHAYFAVITGESLAKNYRLPIEDMIFQNRRLQHGLWAPSKSAELVVFTIRMMLKHTSCVELLLVARDWRNVKREAVWLLEPGVLQGALPLIRRWLPPLDPGLFARCVAALSKPAPLLSRLILARQLRSQLRMYARHSALRSSLIGFRKFATMSARRLTGTRQGMRLQSGGAVIAFVGPEATGKSTLLRETRRWLGEYLRVEQINAGKPPSTILSAGPNLLLPALRALLPTYRSGYIETHPAAENSAEQSQKGYPLIFGLRSALLAYERRALLKRAFARAANGAIVLCDRYPSQVSGAPDSPQLAQFHVARRRSPVRNLLANAERRLYQQIPAPDLVIALSVPLDLAIQRNKTRGKEEPEDFVRRRHAQSSQLVFASAPVFRISTDRPLNDTVADIKKVIWQAL